MQLKYDSGPATDRRSALLLEWHERPGTEAKDLRVNAGVCGGEMESHLYAPRGAPVHTCARARAGARPHARTHTPTHAHTHTH